MDKALSIVYYESVFVALVIQYTMRVRHIVICDVSGYTIFYHIISITYFERVFVSNTQCVCIILSSVACPDPQHFPTLSDKRRNFRKKNIILYKTCVLIFSANERDMVNI